MSNLKIELDELNVFEYEYDKYKGKNEISGLTAEGACFRFAEWLKSRGYEDEPYDVLANTSSVRDGNRLDIHDNYQMNNLGYNVSDSIEITFLYVYNNTLWAVLYDSANDSYYGEFEIPAI